jgi:hypothetical protein
VCAQPKRHTWDPRQGECNYQKGHYCDTKGPGVKAPRCGVCDTLQLRPFQAPSNICRYTTVDLHIVATQYAGGNGTTKLRSAARNREVTPNNGMEASFDATIYDAKEDTMDGKKRRKQHPQRLTAAANYDGGNDKEAGGSSVGHVTIAACSSKHKAWPPIDHFK